MPSSGPSLRTRRRLQAAPLDKEEPRITIPRNPVNKRDSWVLTVRPSGRIPMSDNSIATTPNSRVAPGGGGPTRTSKEVRGVNR
jgi:hypothetical protein